MRRYAHPFDRVLALVDKNLVEGLIAKCGVVADRKGLPGQLLSGGMAQSRADFNRSVTTYESPAR